jgi:hypothetical protein
VSFEKRLEAMSGQLLKKQLLLDDATCGKAALSARLRAAQQAVQRLEASQALASAQQATTPPFSPSAPPPPLCFFLKFQIVVTCC